MSLLEIELNVESPLEIMDVVVGNIHGVVTSGYISGSTIKGAFLAQIFRQLNIDDVANERMDPRIAVSPFYALAGNKQTRPVPNFIYKCKICGAVLTELLAKVLNGELTDLTKLEIPDRCPENHIASLKKVSGLYYIDDKGINFYSIKTVQLESIGLDRRFGRVDGDMLFSYLAVSPGEKFKGFMYFDDPEVEDWFKKLGDQGYIWVGRGVSRGMGKCRYKIAWIDTQEHIEKRARMIEEHISSLNNRLVLMAISQISIFGNNFYGFNPIIPDGLEPINIYLDKNFIPTGISTWKGYSLSANLPKLGLKGLAPGTLYFYRIKGDVSKVSRKIVELELKGFGPPNNIGLNMLEVFMDANKFI